MSEPIVCVIDPALKGEASASLCEAFVVSTRVACYASLTPSPPKVATPTLNRKIDRINQDSPLRVFLGI